MSRETSKEDCFKFLHEYVNLYRRTPNLLEWKEKNGFPCHKEKLLKLFGKYNNLISECGFQYEYGQRHYDKQKLLDDLRSAVYNLHSRPMCN